MVWSWPVSTPILATSQLKAERLEFPDCFGRVDAKTDGLVKCDFGVAGITNFDGIPLKRPWSVATDLY